MNRDWVSGLVGVQLNSEKKILSQAVTLMVLEESELPIIDAL